MPFVGNQSFLQQATQLHRLNLRTCRCLAPHPHCLTRSLSLADLEAANHQDSRRDGQRLPTVSTDENLAAAESALFMPLQPVPTDDSHHSGHDMQEPMSIEAESGSASEPGADRGLELGATLPQGFRLQEPSHGESDDQSDGAGSPPRLTCLVAGLSMQVPPRLQQCTLPPQSGRPHCRCAQLAGLQSELSSTCSE